MRRRTQEALEAPQSPPEPERPETSRTAVRRRARVVPLARGAFSEETDDHCTDDPCDDGDECTAPDPPRRAHGGARRRRERTQTQRPTCGCCKLRNVAGYCVRSFVGNDPRRVELFAEACDHFVRRSATCPLCAGTAAFDVDCDDGAPGRAPGTRIVLACLDCGSRMPAKVR